MNKSKLSEKYETAGVVLTNGERLRGLTRFEFVVALVVSIALLLLPLTVVEYPPFLDYPFHLARIQILHNWNTIPEFRQWYEIQSPILPNIGFDSVALVLANFMSVQTAGLVFIGLTNVVTLTGVIFLHRCLHSNLTLWPFVAAFLVYNWILIFGFMSYVFGVGLMLWGAGCWILLRRLGIWPRLLGGTLITVVLFFCHLVPLALYGVFVAGYELQRSYGVAKTDVRAAVRDLVVGALPFVLPLALFWISRTAHEEGLFSYSDPWPVVKLLKLRMLLSADWVLDLSLAVVGAIATLVVWRYGTLRLAKSTALALLLLVIVYFAAPMAAFTGTYTDTRLPMVLAFMAIAAVQVDLNSAALRYAAVTILALFLAARMLFMAVTWDDYCDQIEAVADSISVIPEKSMLFAASAIGDPRPANIDLVRWQPPLTYASSLVSLQKPVFSANTFAHPGQHLIAIRPEYEALYDAQGQSVKRTETAADVEAFANHVRDVAVESGHGNEPLYLLLLYPKRLQGPGFPSFQVVRRGEQFVLFALNAASQGR